jgi:hypothetical protein
MDQKEPTNIQGKCPPLKIKGGGVPPKLPAVPTSERKSTTGDEVKKNKKK